MNFLGIIKIGINFQVGWESLVRNKFRSILTLLGIVLGIFIVVVSVSLSQSIKDFMISEFKTFSGNTLIFMWHEPWIEKDDGRWVRNPIKDNFWLEDVSEMAERCPSITKATGWQPLDGKRVEFGNKNRNYFIQGCLVASADIFNWEMEYGRIFQQWEMDTSQRVCVLGHKVRTDLFGQTNPIGQDVRIDRERFTVIGSLTSKATGLMRMIAGSEMDETVYLPIPTVGTYFMGKNNRWLAIFATAESYEQVGQAQAEIRALWRQKFGSDQYHNMGTSAEAIKFISKNTRIISYVLGGLAAITLIVGGIGTMNIMLVSVSERTQEIGLRKAIGAKSNDIRFQFLIEAIVICLFGGLIGTGLAMLVVNGAGWAMTTFVIKDSVWPATVRIEAALAAFSVSTLVGILAGFYPSNKAANLTPVEALRFD